MGFTGIILVAAVLSLRSVAANLVMNGAFDSDFSVWTNAGGTGTAWSSEDANASPSSGSGNAVKTTSKTVVLPPRGGLLKAVGSDVIANLFGLTGRSYGYITPEGDVSRLVAVAAVSAQVDPTDARKGLKTAQADGFLLNAPQVMTARDAERRFAGVEKSFQRRTNLVLLEVAGEPCEVTVRLNGPAGARLAERVYQVGAGQYFQITDVFGPAGLNLSDGPFQNVEVTAAVSSGNGRVVAVATVNDNIQKPPIFTLLPPGPAQDSIGF